MTPTQGLKKTHAVMCAIVGAAIICTTSPAHAQDTTVTTETVGPNRALLRSGIVVFGLSYVPAFVVASTNTRSDDDYLYIPVAGPWLDLAHREPCGTCNGETLNKALLVTGGVFQTVGALEFLGSFLFMEKTTVREVAAVKERPVADRKPTLTILPGSVASGYGIVATSQF
jgi:hypothetical protein